MVLAARDEPAPSGGALCPLHPGAGRDHAPGACQERHHHPR